MSDNITLDLRLADQVFRLATTAEQKPQLERSAELFNEKFAQLRKEAPTLDRSKLTIMIAMEFAQEILTLNKSLQVYTHGEYLLQNIVDDLDKQYPEHLNDDKKDADK